MSKGKCIICGAPSSLSDLNEAGVCSECRKQPGRKLTARESTWKRQGIDMDEGTWGLILDDGDGRCAICDRIPSEIPGELKALACDHNHVTGKPRGPLCAPCNLGLGLFQDDPKRLRAAARYVVFHLKADELIKDVSKKEDGKSDNGDAGEVS